MDDCTREYPHLSVECSLPVRCVIARLEALPLVRGTQQAIACDNGPEFVSLALDHWESPFGIRLDFIRPGRHVENCFIESFNERLRDECLNLRLSPVTDVGSMIKAWRQEYNSARLHAGSGIARRKRWQHIVNARGGTPKQLTQIGRRPKSGAR